MKDRILVTYASKHGATKEIAEEIADVFIENYIPVDVLPINEVDNLVDYSAVIIGSAVYIGQWRKEAVQFLKRNSVALAARPTWLFSTGPTGEGDPVELLDGWRYPKAIKPMIERIEPRDITVFHGVLDVDDLNFLERYMVKNINAAIGDYRDWDAIDAWAESIITELDIKPHKEF